MLDFGNLSAYEFEDLAKDVLSKYLRNIELRVYKMGPDGGFDIADVRTQKNIMAQAKRYVASSYSKLRSQLEKEVPRVKLINPKQYFVLTSLELSKNEIDEIYGMFSNNMKSMENIWDKIRIDNFLKESENIDILHRHHKLWFSTELIMRKIFTQNLELDTRAYINEIQKNKRYFVETKSYYQLINQLFANNIVLITGNPGVGKTFISKMALLYFVANDYRPIFSSKNSIDDIKKSISLDPSSKQVILMDDFLGQIDLDQSGKQYTNEFISLINFVEKLQNTRLILNTRVNILSIMNSKNNKFEERIGESDIKILQINDLSMLEKAKIVYSSLYYFNVDRQYLEDVCNNYMYLKIVNHPNFNPRLIEHMVKPKTLSRIKPSDYLAEILFILNHPSKIWSDEFESQISKEDRSFMYILFSLGSGKTYMTYLKEAYESYLLNDATIDNTIDHFRNSVTHLSEGLIKISSVDNLQGNKYFEVLNPSVNDYLKDNIPFVEREKILSSGVFIDQFDRLVTDFRNSSHLENLIISKKISVLKYIRHHPYSFALEYVVHNKKFSLLTSAEVIKMLSHRFYSTSFEKYDYYDILSCFISDENLSFYGYFPSIIEIKFLNSVLLNLKYDEAIGFLQRLNTISNNMFESFFSEALYEDIKIKYLVEIVEKINQEDILDYQTFVENNINEEGVSEEDIYNEVISQYESDISKRMKLEPIKIKTDILSEDIESAIQSIDPEIRDSIQMAVKTFYDDAQAQDFDYDDMIAKDEQKDIATEIESMFTSLLAE